MKRRSGGTATAVIALALATSLSAVIAQAAEPLGRLFLTPQERAELEARRRAGTGGTVAVQPAQSLAPSATAAAPVATKKSAPAQVPTKMTGYVLRSSGNNTVWIDFEPRYRAAIPPSAQQSSTQASQH